MVIVPDKNEPLFICTDELDYNTESYTTIVLNEKGNEVLGEYSEIVAVENNDISNVWYEENVLKHKKDGKFGLINFEGKEIVKPIYDEIYALEGVENSIILVKDNKKGLLNNKTGEIIIEPKYIEIKAISSKHEDGYIVKNEKNKVGLIGKRDQCMISHVICA